MKGIDFPLSPTKIAGQSQKYNLSDPAQRAKYFTAKTGTEIKKIRKYLAKNSFVAYLLGKKNSGKGTYSKLFMEAIGGDLISHVAVGDIVRDTHEGLSSKEKKQKLIGFLKANYRGFHGIDELIDIIEGRSASKLISTELVIALLKYEISKKKKSAIFIDGFPRGLDQIPHSMFFKELIGYGKEKDFFVFIDLPEKVIDERIKYRVICPVCKTPRSTKLLATKNVGYDQKKNEFYLICDDSKCGGPRMVAKEGDALGIAPIRDRLKTDEEIFKHLLKINGIPKVYLRNSIPVTKAAKLVDDYEITPAYSYKYNSKNSKVNTIEKPWVFKDDNKTPSYSLLPAAVVVSLIKQIANVLEL